MDRRWALLAVILLVPASLAQTIVMEDPDGDAQTTAAGQASPVQGSTGPYDLVAFSVEEAPREFTFTVHVADLAMDTEDVGNGVIHVQFQHADQTYRVSWMRDQFESIRYAGELRRYDGGSGAWHLLDRPAVAIDGAADALSLTIPRDYLLDGNGTAPQAGRILEQFQAHSRGTVGVFRFDGFTSVQVSDRMPDSGTGIPYEITHGLAQSGHVRLASDNPVRASNGEKGTFVFMVEVSNLREEEDRFDLKTTGVPDGWDITLPAATLRIGGNFTRAFPVLASVPFQHAHGAFEEFVLEMHSQSDPSAVGRLQLGIRYLAIPQPAGHHDQLYIHTRMDANRDTGSVRGIFEDASMAYMNTLEDDELDEDIDATPDEWSGDRFVWRIFLEPGLQMGLDFDRNRTGEVTVQIASQFDLAGAELTGSLVHLRGQRAADGTMRGAEHTVLAQFVPGTPKDVRGSAMLDGVLQPTQASEFVPYDPHAALMLEVVISTDGPAFPVSPDTAPRLQGGQVRLPLNEYRDPVEGILNTLAGLSFRHDSPPERFVNPAETVLFNLTLRNDGAVDDVFTLRVNGTNASWARLLGDQKVFVPTGRERLVVAAVSPPEDAPDGDIIDLIVTAASQADPSIQGNIRVVAIVDSTLDHPDESHLIQDVDASLRSKKASALPILMSLATVALAACVRRR